MVPSEFYQMMLRNKNLNCLCKENFNLEEGEIKVEYYYKGVKVGIWGKADNRCTIVVEDKETADRIGGFERHDEIDD